MGVLCNAVAVDSDLQKQLISIQKQYGNVPKGALIQMLQVSETKES